MFAIAANTGVFLLPFLCTIFCLNLVSILKKIKVDEDTGLNTFWLTLSFTLIMWSIAIIGVGAL
ncbi:hypothetical protein BN1058_01850 [Paraliobacillus sp. PM-2]|uniref:hypothetical protein n=1 Tax=Paraliobacillus sp. PM-2 TaxID=1462524 RepID=UPI00061CC26D|nr:hypothetical protein [Paraliobacillus sp. PM-2]CQR47527.1 hypothetical protein BN1058_01850 [Paraliobacillus sp. PM-2]